MTRRRHAIAACLLCMAAGCASVPNVDALLDGRHAAGVRF